MKKEKLGNRFLILERDNFTCQYCGRSAPEVVLEVDHIVPRIKGGKDIATNMITACRDCNRGKMAKDIKLIKEPEHIELSNENGFTSYPTRCIRMSDKTWKNLKTDRANYGLSWNTYILKKLEEYENRQKTTK